MNRHHALALLLCLTLLLASGCEQTSIAEQEAIRNAATLQASTPSLTPTLTVPPPPTDTPTLSPTLGPSPTLTSTSVPAPTAVPTQTPVPTLTPLPPTATPNPALANFSLCTQTAGEAEGGRFSAQINGITTTLQAAFDRVTIGLSAPSDSAPPHALARCLSAADDTAINSGSGYLLLVDLGDWLHDDAFKSTTISSTQALSGSTILKSLELRSDTNATVGATLAFGMEQPFPFRLTLEQNPYRLVLDVAKSGAIGPNNDALSVPTTSTAAPDSPLFYVQDGDLWVFDGGKATNRTKDVRGDQFGAVSAIAASSAAGRVAFCAVAAGADIGDRLPQSELWSIDFDGNNLQNLSDDVLACADPSFSSDGKTIAFTATENDANPPRYSIWTVSADGGDSQPISAADDEWSRFGPQWIGSDRLVYVARSEDGRGTLFVHNADGSEIDIGADLIKGDTYQMLGRPLVAPDGSAIAVEGLKAAGADLLLIDPNGAPIPSQSAISSGYWNRPLAWNSDGNLFYLSIACPSDVAQAYSVHSRSLKNGDDRLIGAGTTVGTFGSFASTGKGLAYVASAHAPAGPRGPLNRDPQSPSTLWFWEVGGSGARAQLVSAQTAIGDVAR